MQLSSWSSWQQVFQSGWKPYPGPALKFGMVDMLEAMHWREDDFKSYAAQVCIREDYKFIYEKEEI